MRYRTLLFDLDHCLLDSDTSERMAFESTMQAVGIEPTPAHRDAYDRINSALWRSVERGERTPNDVRHERWEAFVDELGLNADAMTMSEVFVEGLGAFGELYPGTESVLQRVSGDRRVALVTNGIGVVQRTRIARLELDRFFEAYVISGEAGVAKPDPAIFESIAAELGGVDKSTTVMIGDSLTSDIAGGQAFGVDTCWFNPHGADAPDPGPTHEIASLADLFELV